MIEKLLNRYHRFFLYIYKADTIYFLGDCYTVVPLCEASCHDVLLSPATSRG